MQHGTGTVRRYYIQSTSTLYLRVHSTHQAFHSKQYCTVYVGKLKLSILADTIFVYVQRHVPGTCTVPVVWVHFIPFVSGSSRTFLRSVVHRTVTSSLNKQKMTIVYALISRGKTVLAEYTATSGKELSIICDLWSLTKLHSCVQGLTTNISSIGTVQCVRICDLLKCSRCLDFAWCWCH